jgi:hypothetical protein
MSQRFCLAITASFLWVVVIISIPYRAQTRARAVIGQLSLS